VTGGRAAAPEGRPSGATVAGGRDDQPLYSIGEVLAQLRVEFPDTTISKLRFLETEGLVEPQRTPSGYRKYSRSDLFRLRYVLTAQRDHYLPLRVIREQLEQGVPEEPPTRPTLVALGPDDELPAPGRADPAERWSAAQVCVQAGLQPRELRDLEQHGLISPDPAGRYDADALAIAQVAVAFAEYGIHARHLRAWRAAADREIGVFAALIAPLMRHPDPTEQARAAETVRELTALSQRLHSALVRRGLRNTL
jgi:DNA-binding transcriptional MerR regulator